MLLIKLIQLLHRLKNLGASKRSFENLSPVNFVCELVIRGEHDDGSLTNRKGEKHLRCSGIPDLKDINNILDLVTLKLLTTTNIFHFVNVDKCSFNTLPLDCKVLPTVV